jgi:hypothetical protein
MCSFCILDSLPYIQPLTQIILVLHATRSHLIPIRQPLIRAFGMHWHIWTVLELECLDVLLRIGLIFPPLLVAVGIEILLHVFFNRWHGYVVSPVRLALVALFLRRGVHSRVVGRIGCRLAGDFLLSLPVAVRVRRLLVVGVWDAVVV